jgi:hypothetical protein
MIVRRDLGEQRPYPSRLHRSVPVVEKMIELVELRLVVVVVHRLVSPSCQTKYGSEIMA